MVLTEKAIVTAALSSLSAVTRHILNFLFGVYALVLSNKLFFQNTKDIQGDSGVCMAATTLNLLLAVGIIQIAMLISGIIGFSLDLLSQINAWAEGEMNIIYRICTTCQYFLSVLLGLTSLGLLIATSVFVWRDQCNVLSNNANNGYFFSVMQTFLIIQWTVPTGIGVVLFCIAFGCFWQYRNDRE